MDLRLIGATVILIACSYCGHVTSHPVEVTSNATSDATKECHTARNVSGVCIHRQRCDYGTPAIDMTLFAPHGYIRPCAMEEVCCPESAIAHVETNTIPSIDSDEDF